MKIGDKVVLCEDIYTWDYPSGEKLQFKKGHIFTIVGDDDLRGFTIEDNSGVTLAETRFVKMKSIEDIREEKINKILNDTN
jgi:hypothetical protein